jgi:hypothetical protein
MNLRRWMKGTVIPRRWKDDTPNADKAFKINWLRTSAVTFARLPPRLQRSTRRVSFELGLARVYMSEPHGSRYCTVPGSPNH